MSTMTPAEALEILRGLHLRCECAGQRVVQDAAGIAVDAIAECEGLRARVADLETLCDETESALLLQTAVSELQRLERQPIRWRPISEAPKDCEVLLWSSFYKLAFLGEWSATGAWVDAHGEKIKEVTKFAEVAWPEGESC